MNATLAYLLGGLLCLSACQAYAEHHARKAGIEQRVRLLANALELDAKQQKALRKLLEQQRDDLQKVWNDAAMPAAYRVAATQAVSDQTSDAIRDLLTDEQRKKYKPPRQPHAPPEGLGQRTIEEWMYPAKATEQGR
jgi:hypothetical protein